MSAKKGRIKNRKLWVSSVPSKFTYAIPLQRRQVLQIVYIAWLFEKVISFLVLPLKVFGSYNVLALHEQRCP